MNSWEECPFNKCFTNSCRLQELVSQQKKYSKQATRKEATPPPPSEDDSKLVLYSAEITLKLYFDILAGWIYCEINNVL